MVVDETSNELLLLLHLNRGSVALSSLKSFVSAWDEEHETAWTLGITCVATLGVATLGVATRGITLPMAVI